MRSTFQKIIFLILFSFSLEGVLQAQIKEIESDQKDVNAESEFGSWKDRFVVGGNLGAGFGSFTYVDVSPLVGYKITKSLTVGLGFTYQFQKVNYDSPLLITDYSGNVIGGRLFSEYDIFYGLFAHAEYEHLWYNFKYEDAIYGEYSGDVPALYLGGGYNFMIGERSKFQVMILYDVLYTTESLNPNPFVIRMGFNIGL